MIPALKEEKDLKELFDEEQIAQWLHNPITQRFMDELLLRGFLMQQDVTETHRAGETTQATFKSGQVAGLAEAVGIPEEWADRIKEEEERYGKKEELSRTDHS